MVGLALVVVVGTLTILVGALLGCFPKVCDAYFVFEGCFIMVGDGSLVSDGPGVVVARGITSSFSTMVGVGVIVGISSITSTTVGEDIPQISA